MTKELKVHPTHQLKGSPDRVNVEEEIHYIHPSHETFTGKPRYKIGDRVKLVCQPGSINDVRKEGTVQMPIFSYQVLMDETKELSIYVPSSDLTSLE